MQTIPKNKSAYSSAGDLLSLWYIENGVPSSRNGGDRWLPPSVTGTGNPFYNGYCYISNCYISFFWEEHAPIT